jgi:hypothetical protein
MMAHIVRSLFLVVALLFSIGALTGSAASASQFHSEGEFTTFSGSQVNTHKFRSTAGEVTCGKATFQGSINAKTWSWITVNATYSECHTIIFGSTISSTVNMNGCGYTLWSNELVDLTCPAGKVITVTAAGCTISTPSQTFAWFEYSNKENKHINLTAHGGFIKYSHTGFTCGTGSGTNGTYDGTTTFAGDRGRIWFE